jgi:hypothetical protein
MNAIAGTASVALAVRAPMGGEKENDDGAEARRELRRSALDRRLSRLFTRLLLGLAVVLAAGSVITWLDLRTGGLNPIRSKTFWAAIAGTVVLAFAGWKFSTKAKFKILLWLMTFGLVELLLQAAGWVGVLPGVNTKERVPFGRVYWTGEGLGNSVRNRYGWYYPEFESQKSNKLAIIGDSFVEAVEVHRTRNMSAVLGKQMRGRAAAPAVMALGNHGTGPAQHLEALKYAHQYFSISHAILVIYLGNDITDCSAKLTQIDPEQFIFYSLKPDQSLMLEPVGERAQTAYLRSLETAHRPIWLFAPRLAVSHCMSVQLPLSVRNTRNRRRMAEQNGATNHLAEAQFAQLGLQAAPFALNPSVEARDAMTVLKLLLGRAADFAAEKGIQLQIMTVPFFPPDFYLQTGPEWSAKMGDYDFLAPERTLSEWANQHHIPFLGLGELMRKHRLTTAGIRALYFFNGSGHFNESGHRFAAQALDAAFFGESTSKP